VTAQRPATPAGAANARAVAHVLAVMAEQVTARGVHGVVCAAAPLAAQAGAAALADGGNAFDAAVTAALAETVLLPPKCGLGGDLVAIRWHRGDSDAIRQRGDSDAIGHHGDPDALLAIGGAPAGLADVARSGAWRDVGPLSVGPPGAPAGYDELAGLGRLGRARVAAPAIRLATDGFPWALVCTRLAEQAADLVAEMHPEGCDYYPGGAPIRPGTVVRLPGLADVLGEWVERGRELMAGPVGRAVVDAVQARGGVLGMDDVAGAVAEWTPCAGGPLGGRRVWVTPAPTHGPSLLEVAAELDAGWSPARVRASVLRAIRRRRDVLADPSGTSIVSAADDAGDVVVVVHSNSFPRFGSGIVVPGYQLPLANRAGRGFTPVPGHPNFPAAGRRPATTLHAWAVSDDGGRPQLFGGTPGGANQMPWNAQSLARISAGCTDPGLLVLSPLWEWLPDDDGVRIEAGFTDDEAAELAAAARRAVTAPRWGCKSAQQVIRVPGPGEAWVAAADPRTVGLALGV
jgi:gamma-glutamyltranspeptidase / glutathione hydrolase